MRALLSSLVAMSLLIHAAIGCCWHHVHTDSCCEDSRFEQSTDSDGDHPCDQHDGHSHGPCKDHCQGTCHYLPVQKTQIDTQVALSPFDFFAIAPPTCDVQLFVQHHAECTHESAAGPPVRLHLFQQLLLI
ncbi:MAG TPA: hypothetical protein VH107_06445 [Lacipirellulaceae bacterium]|nr:hypothetical protein [Lacipirellulaceae bacterium]